MDNITHSLVGAYAGHLLAGKIADKRSRAAIITCSILANNAPDLDLLYSSRTSVPLGYLLHHRGHTHTLLFAVLITLLASLIYYVIRKRGWSRFDSPICSRLCLTIGVGNLLHLALDSLNSYGVHPFWPLNNTWYYGDSVFILEPTLWVLLSTAFLTRTNSTPLRSLLALIALGVNCLVAFSGYVAPPIVVAFLTFSATTVFLSLRLPSYFALAGLASLGFVATLIALSQYVATLVRNDTRHQLPGATLVDIIRSPAPVDALCWNVIRVYEEKDAYHLEHGVVAVIKSHLSVCQQMRQRRQSDQPARPPAINTDSSILWTENTSIPLSTLRTDSRELCQVRAFLRFSRAPVLVHSPDGSVQFRDARFDRIGRRNFTSFSTHPSDEHCPALVPDWRPPRADLLDGH